MKALYDITVRYCGSVGYIGILIIEGEEVYRTGTHHPTATLAFSKVIIESTKYLN